MSLVFLGYCILFFMISERDLNEEVCLRYESTVHYLKHLLSFAISCWKKCFSIPFQRASIFLLSSLGGTVYFMRSCHFSAMTRGCGFLGGWFLHVQGSASSYLPPSALTTAALSGDGSTERLICSSCDCPHLKRNKIKANETQQQGKTKGRLY